MSGLVSLLSATIGYEFLCSPEFCLLSYSRLENRHFGVRPFVIVILKKILAKKFSNMIVETIAVQLTWISLYYRRVFPILLITVDGGLATKSSL